ncbi:MAG: hypothetical protein H8Z69_01300 [Nanohaloarchaea archaeon]|nr:hypothetical protein [Candidatus Nanohaloarchaea archaeon]
MPTHYGERIYDSVSKRDLEEGLRDLRDPIGELLDDSVDESSSVYSFGVEDVSEIGFNEEYSFTSGQEQELDLSIALAELDGRRLMTSIYRDGNEDIYEEFTEKIDEAIEGLKAGKRCTSSNSETWVFNP